MSIMEQMPIPEFDGALEDVPRLDLQEFIERQQADAASFIHSQYNRLDESLDVTYARADQKLRRASVRIGMRALKTTNPKAYKKKRRAHYLKHGRNPKKW